MLVSAPAACVVSQQDRRQLRQLCSDDHATKHELQDCAKMMSADSHILSAVASYGSTSSGGYLGSVG